MKNQHKNIILFLFFASGISGLIYEIVWLRILGRIMGVTTYATAIVLASFMAGLAIGSFVFGIFIDRRRDPLKVFAVLEIVIAIAAIITPVLFKILFPFYKYLYLVSSHNMLLITIARVVISFFLLLIPTIIMGGTLPVLISYMVKKEGSFGRNFSLLYGVNTFGAVFGVLLSGFITIGFFGEWSTILIGAVINLVVGGIAYHLYKEECVGKKTSNAIKTDISLTKDIPVSSYHDGIRSIVLIAVLVSGFTALSYEVIWSRQLILYLQTSIYAFCAMLAVFLTGIAMGSIYVSKYIDKLKTPLFLFGILELLVGLVSIFGLYLFPLLDGRTVTQLSSPLLLIFPLTLLFGAIFPVATLCYTKSLRTAGASVGTLYGFNTIGNVTGSLCTGFLFIVLLGSSKTVVVLACVNILLGVSLVLFEPNKLGRVKARYFALIPVAVIMSYGLWGRDSFLGTVEQRIRHNTANYQIFLNKESPEGTVTSYSADGQKRILINGIGQTCLCTETKLMAHLPIIYADDPKKLLVICFGMGTTVRSACVYDNLDITAVELVPLVYESFKYYYSDVDDILNRENLRIIVDDGRNFLLFCSKKFDIITVDPSPPIYSAGTVNLYTQEFFYLCKDHLNDGGVMCLWFPSGSIGGGTEQDFLYVLSTFHSVFPYVTVWKGPHGWGFYLIGTLKKIDLNVEKVNKFFSNQEFLDDMGEYDKLCINTSQFMDLKIMNRENVDVLANNSMIISDNNPYTEFPLWRWMFDKGKRK